MMGWQVFFAKNFKKVKIAGLGHGNCGNLYALAVE
jgi:hypothetical protein